MIVIIEIYIFFNNYIFYLYLFYFTFVETFKSVLFYEIFEDRSHGDFRVIGGLESYFNDIEWLTGKNLSNS